MSDKKKREKALKTATLSEGKKKREKALTPAILSEGIWVEPRGSGAARPQKFRKNG